MTRSRGSEATAWRSALPEWPLGSKPKSCASSFRRSRSTSRIGDGGRALARPALKGCPVAHGEANVTEHPPQVGSELLTHARIGAVELEVHHRFAPLLVAAQ